MNHVLRGSTVLNVVVMLTAIAPGFVAAQEVPSRFVDEQTAAVVRFNLDRIDVMSSPHRLIRRHSAASRQIFSLLDNRRIWQNFNAAAAPAARSETAQTPLCTSSKTGPVRTIASFGDQFHVIITSPVSRVRVAAKARAR